MNEGIPKNESIPVTDEQVIEALKSGPTEEAETVIVKWEDGLRAESDQVYEASGSLAKATKDMTNAIFKAMTYYRGGRVKEAIEDLKETADAIGSTNLFEGTSLYEQANTILDKMVHGETL